MYHSKNKLSPVVIIGAGRVGRALSQALYNKGLKIAAIISRSLESAERCAKASNCSIFSDQLFHLPDETESIFITTPDEVISSVSNKLAQTKNIIENKFIAHTSGSRTSENLEPLRKKGALVASFHPIQTFAGDKLDWEKFYGIFFGIEGDEKALKICRSFVELLGGKYLIVPKDSKSLYHASCVFSSNYLIALMDISIQMMANFNLNQEEIAQLLLPLLKGTVENFKNLGLERALTGPISRGDIQTVQKHVNILKVKFPELLPLYCLLGKRVLKVSEKRGNVEKPTLEAIHSIFESEQV